MSGRRHDEGAALASVVGQRRRGRRRGHWQLGVGRVGEATHEAVADEDADDEDADASAPTHPRKRTRRGGAKLYQEIVHPVTLVKYDIGSLEGQDILRNLLQSVGYQ